MGRIHLANKKNLSSNKIIVRILENCFRNLGFVGASILLIDFIFNENLNMKFIQ